MKVLTYSERGLVDSLVYSLSDKSTKELLMLRFGNELKDISDLCFYIEHSLSDFGSPDLLISFKNNGTKTLIFVEAKVSNGNQKWTLQKQYDDYCKKEDKNITSNFFRQIALKNLLTKNKTNIPVDGLTCDDSRVYGRKKNRKLGNNEVVQRLFYEVIKEAKDIWFLGLVPDDTLDLNKMKKENRADYYLFSKVKYITWSSIKDFAVKNRMKDLLDNFEWNKGIIFNDNN